MPDLTKFRDNARDIPHFAALQMALEENGITCQRVIDSDTRAFFGSERHAFTVVLNARFRDSVEEQAAIVVLPRTGRWTASFTSTTPAAIIITFLSHLPTA